MVAVKMSNMKKPEMPILTRIAFKNVVVRGHFRIKLSDAPCDSRHGRPFNVIYQSRKAY